MNTPADEGVTPEDKTAAPAESPVIAAAAPKSKLGLILGIFVVGALAIVGARYALDAQIPKGDPGFEKESSEGDSGVNVQGGAATKNKADL